jgi:hypothetical protein
LIGTPAVFNLPAAQVDYDFFLAGVRGSGRIIYRTDTFYRFASLFAPARLFSPAMLAGRRTKMVRLYEDRGEWMRFHGRICRPTLLSLATYAVACASTVSVVAASPSAVSSGPNGSEATSNGTTRNQALRAIPWRQLAPEHRRAAQFVVKNASMYRRLPTRVIDCDPDMFNFLLQHPEVVIDVWRVMGISQVKLEKMPDGSYRGTDGVGTTGSVRFMFSKCGQNAQNLAVVYAEGSYEGKPFIMPLKAQSVLVLRSQAVREASGRHHVTVTVDSFVRIDQVGVELFAKTVQPWISKTADRNFIETLSFVSNFSRTAEKNPQGMQRLATRLVGIDEPTRTALVAVCFRTAERYAQKTSPPAKRVALVAQRTATPPLPR